MHRTAVAQRKRGQPSLINLDEGKVCFFVEAYKSCLDNPLLAHGRNLVGKIHRRHCKRNVDALCPLDDMSVCHDVAVRLHDPPRTDRMLAGYERRLTTVVFFQRPIAGNQNLNHRRRNPGGKLLDGGIKLLQHRWRFCRPGSHQFCFVDVRLPRLTTGDGRGLRCHLLTKTRYCKPYDAKARSKTKKREVEDPFRTASWEEHRDTPWAHLYRVTTQIMITLEWNKSELLFRGNSQHSRKRRNSSGNLSLSLTWRGFLRSL